jgi:hypothetical protein
MRSALGRLFEARAAVGVLLCLVVLVMMVASDAADAARRHHVIANVDEDGGVQLANKPGGFYMGRLLVNWSFDRHGEWYLGSNGSNYAWAFAYGNSNACLWAGPSAGKQGYTAGTWASAAGEVLNRCNETQRSWLAQDVNVGSHFNCEPNTDATNGTPKSMLTSSTLYYNVRWAGGTMGYDGGTLETPASGTVTTGTTVWYRYTSRDGTIISAYVPGKGWGFFPIGVLDRTRTGWWSAGPVELTQPCSDTNLYAGQQLSTSNPQMQTSSRSDPKGPRRFRLVMQGDGNLVLYISGGGPLWASNTESTTGNRAVMESNGNFVIYNASGSAIWSSGTGGNPGAHLAVQADGNVVIYSSGGTALWATNTCCH